MADVSWIKITTDMFDNRKIKHLRRLPEGNNIVLIWVMLLTMAGRCNAGGMIFLTENIPYTPKMLADELDFQESTIRLALDALEKLGMIRVDGFLSIAGWEEHQNIDGMDRIREQNRIRKQRQREREKLLLSDGHGTVTGNHATDKIREDKNRLEEDKKEDKKKTAKRFTPPSIQEVKAYCVERGNNVDPDRFIDFYSSKGWMVGKNPMKDWKAAVRTWEKNNFSRPQTGPNGVRLSTERDELDDEMDRILGGGE